MLNRLFTRPQPPHFAALRGLPLLSAISDKEMGILDHLLHYRDYGRGEVIFDEGDEGHAIYFVLSGEVLVCRPGRAQQGFIAKLGPGQIFGEMALLDDSPRLAQVRAVEDCTLAVLFREDFLNLLHTHAVIASKISLALARMLSQRLRETITRFVA